MKKAKFRIALFITGLTFVVIIVTFLLAEVVLRFVRPDLGSSLISDEALGWTSTEYQRFDPTIPKRPDRGRILFLGDSFLAGSGLKSLNQRFPVLMQRDNSRWDIGIFASGGWSIDQEFWAFRQKGKQWHPDLVILAFCANNDIASILAHHYGLPGMLKPYYEATPEGKLQLYDAQGEVMKIIAPRNSNDKDNLKRDSELWKHSYVLRLIVALTHPEKEFTYRPQDYPKVDPIYKLFASRQEKCEEIYRGQDKLTWSPQDGVNHVSAYIHEDFELNSRMWALFELILAEMREEVEQSGGRLVVMNLPVIFNPADVNTIVGGSFSKKFDTPTGPFTFNSAEPRTRLSAICRRQNVILFDPSEDFSKIVNRRGIGKIVWPDSTDRHFSAEGHKILSDLTERWIKETIPE